jgi:hypothetical protein
LGSVVGILKYIILAPLPMLLAWVIAQRNVPDDPSSTVLITSKFTAATALPSEKKPPKINKTAAKIPGNTLNFDIETLLWISCIAMFEIRVKTRVFFYLNIRELTTRVFISVFP